MLVLKQMSIVGTHTHASSGSYDYEVDCRVAGGTQGRESIHLRVRIFRGNVSTGFVVIGHVDRDESFLGREERLALECVELACARFPLPSAHTQPGRSRDDVAGRSARLGGPLTLEGESYQAWV